MGFFYNILLSTNPLVEDTSSYTELDVLSVALNSMLFILFPIMFIMTMVAGVIIIFQFKKFKVYQKHILNVIHIRSIENVSLRNRLDADPRDPINPEKIDNPEEASE